MNGIGEEIKLFTHTHVREDFLSFMASLILQTYGV